MPSFHYTVDTSPMAHSLNTVSGNVNNVSKTVVAMEAGVVAAEQAAANKIKDNVTRGFFNMIHAQLSQKIAKELSRTTAKFNALAQHARALSLTHHRMEADYHKISSNYMSVFNGLNKEMENRIYELDKPAIDLVNRDWGALNKRMCNLASFFGVSQCESIISSAVIEVSNTKHNAQKAITSMTQFMQDEANQVKQVETLMSNISASSTSDLYVPVMVVDSVADRQSNNLNCIPAQNAPFELGTQLRNAIRTQVLSNPGGMEYNSAQDNAEVQRHLSAMISNQIGDERLASTMREIIG